MQVSSINNMSEVNNNYQAPVEKKKVQAQNTEGYEEKAQTPVNPAMYQAMYGVNNDNEEKIKAAKQLAETREKYEMDVKELLAADSRDMYETEIANENKELERIKAEQREKNEENEKSEYERFLEFKHKYD